MTKDNQEMIQMNTPMRSEHLEKCVKHALNIYLRMGTSKIVEKLMEIYGMSKFVVITTNSKRANESLDKVISEEIKSIVKHAEQVNLASKDLLYEAIRLQNEYKLGMEGKND